MVPLVIRLIDPIVRDSLKRCRLVLMLTMIASFFSLAATTSYPETQPDDQDARPELVTYFIGEGDFILRGFIYVPPGRGPFPAILYNHGSGARPGDLDELGPMFVNAGYVFFVPHRRGQGQSRNAGDYIMDVIRAAPDTRRAATAIRQHELHLDDQLAAFEYLTTRGDVDQSRIAAMGCSFGAIQTILGARTDPGYRAAVAFAPSADSWNPSIKGWLTHALRWVDVPIFFIQAVNDYSVEPSLTLAEELVRLGKSDLLRLRIYPPFGQSEEDGHAFCQRADGRDIWGHEVLEFLSATMSPPVAAGPEPESPSGSAPGK